MLSKDIYIKFILGKSLHVRHSLASNGSLIKFGTFGEAFESHVDCVIMCSEDRRPMCFGKTDALKVFCRKPDERQDLIETELLLRVNHVSMLYQVPYSGQLWNWQLDPFGSSQCDYAALYRTVRQVAQGAWAAVHQRPARSVVERLRSVATCIYERLTLTFCCLSVHIAKDAFGGFTASLLLEEDFEEEVNTATLSEAELKDYVRQEHKPKVCVMKLIMESILLDFSSFPFKVCSFRRF